jgi:hypothetical protein
MRRAMSEFEGKAENICFALSVSQFDPQQTSTVGGKRPRRRNFLRDLKVVVLKQASKRQRLRLVRAGARSRWP